MSSTVLQNHLREVRVLQGLSQRELARKADMQHPAISYIETGKRIPTFPTMKRLAQALQVDISDVFS